LPVVLKEIAERLLLDDWYRVSTVDRARKYYIVGCADQAADLEGEVDFSRLEFPIPTKPALSLNGPFAPSSLIISLLIFCRALERTSSGLGCRVPQ